MNAIDELLSEKGKVSTTRVATFLVLAVVLFNITWVTVHGTALPTLSWEWVGLVAAGMGAKVWQKKYENEKSAPTA